MQLSNQPSFSSTNFPFLERLRIHSMHFARDDTPNLNFRGQSARRMALVVTVNWELCAREYPIPLYINAWLNFEDPLVLDLSRVASGNGTSIRCFPIAQSVGLGCYVVPAGRSGRGWIISQHLISSLRGLHTVSHW